MNAWERFAVGMMPWLYIAAAIVLIGFILWVLDTGRDGDR